MGGDVAYRLQPLFEIPPHPLVLWSKRKEIPTKSQLEKDLGGSGDLSKSETGATQWGNVESGSPPFVKLRQCSMN